MELNVLVLMKGTEKFVYMFDDYSHPELLDAMRDHAANPNLEMNWLDYHVLSQKSATQVQHESSYSVRLKD